MGCLERGRQYRLAERSGRGMTPTENLVSGAEAAFDAPPL